MLKRERLAVLYFLHQAIVDIRSHAYRIGDDALIEFTVLLHNLPLYVGMEDRAPDYDRMSFEEIAAGADKWTKSLPYLRDAEYKGFFQGRWRESSRWLELFHLSEGELPED